MLFLAPLCTSLMTPLVSKAPPDAECATLCLSPEEGVISHAFLTCLVRTLPYFHGFHSHLSPSACAGGPGEALLVPGARPWGQLAPCSVEPCQPSRGAAGLRHRTAPQAAWPWSGVFSRWSWLSGRMSGWCLELLRCFQSGSQTSTSCTAQGRAVETWRFSVDSKQSLTSEKNNCAA